MTNLLKKIVIIGGGVSGLKLATSLGNELGRKKIAKITLVDCNYNYIWKPLLHEVASGLIDYSTESVSYIFHAYENSFKFLLGKMYKIDRKNKKIFLHTNKNINDKSQIKYILNYDILVIAIGSKSNNFNISGVQDNCLFLDNINEAIKFNNRMMNLFLKFNDVNTNKYIINISIVGGGLTGVELAAAIYNSADLLNKYNVININKCLLKVNLIEAGERILPSLPINLSLSVHKELSKLGVNILTNTLITKITSNGMYTKNGEYIYSELIAWVAGIKASDYLKNLDGLETNNINQLIVLPTLQTTYDTNIFAMGDCSSCVTPEGKIIPPRAQVAHQMSLFLHKNIIRLINKELLINYTYTNKGSLVSLSKFNTIGIVVINIIKKSVFLQGFIARIIYLSLYRSNQISLHGIIKTFGYIITDWINKLIKPKIKIT
ncbi:MAG: NAD(P)/FAD-dependent oxidoreductase [Enterobacterales bacterium]